MKGRNNILTEKCNSLEKIWSESESCAQGGNTQKVWQTTNGGVMGGGGKLLPPPKWSTLYYERTVDPSGLRILKMECVLLRDFEDVKYYMLPSFIIAVNNVPLWRWRNFSVQGLPRTLQGDWRFFASSWRDVQQPDSGKKLIRMRIDTPFCTVSLYVTIIRNVTSTLNEFVRVRSRCVSVIWKGKINISCNLTIFIRQCGLFNKDRCVQTDIDFTFSC
jgi:hypothetical protein